MREASSGRLTLHESVGLAAALAAFFLFGSSPVIARDDEPQSRADPSAGSRSTPAESTGERQLGRVSAPSGGATAESQALPPAQGSRDFLFGRPRGWIAFRGSWLMPRAGGDLFAFVNDQLTVEKKDFNAPGVAGEAGFTLTPGVDLAVGLEFNSRRVASEYRRFIDNRGLPINQSTTLSQTNVSGSVKVALGGRGRSISRYAFVPRTFVPYVGAGGGLFYYELKQSGDFVDFVTLRVFNDLFRSSGWTPSGHAFGGTDVRLWRSLFANLEGRYVWAHGDLGPDFVGFDGIDLTGFKLSSGLSVVF